MTLPKASFSSERLSLALKKQTRPAPFEQVGIGHDVNRLE